MPMLIGCMDVQRELGYTDYSDQSIVCYGLRVGKFQSHLIQFYICLLDITVKKLKVKAYGI